MTTRNARIPEVVAIAGVLDPKTVANSEQLSDIIDMSRFHQVAFVFLTGNMASETIDMLVQSSAAANMGSPSTVKSATQLAADASANDNKQVVIVVREDELTEGHRYVRGRAITGGATGGMMAAVALGWPKFGPGTNFDSADIVEIKD